MLFQSAIQRIIPHRYPFLLVDRVIELVPGERIVGIKRLSANDPACGVQSGAAFVAGGILFEAVIQLGAILVLDQPQMAGKIAMVLHVSSGQLLQPVMPGDTLQLEAKILKLGQVFGELRGAAYRDGELIAEGQMRFAVADAPKADSG